MEVERNPYISILVLLISWTMFALNLMKQRCIVHKLFFFFKLQVHQGINGENIMDRRRRRKQFKLNVLVHQNRLWYSKTTNKQTNINQKMSALVVIIWQIMMLAEMVIVVESHSRSLQDFTISQNKMTTDCGQI